jgi:hypothetical protein
MLKSLVVLSRLYTTFVRGSLLVCPCTQDIQEKPAFTFLSLFAAWPPWALPPPPQGRAVSTRVPSAAAPPSPGRARGPGPRTPIASPERRLRRWRWRATANRTRRQWQRRRCALPAGRRWSPPPTQTPTRTSPCSRRAPPSSSSSSRSRSRPCTSRAEPTGRWCGTLHAVVRARAQRVAAAVYSPSWEL